MPKIVITEIDNTSPGFDATSSDVAYVPGCVDVSQASLYDETTGEYIGLEPNKPTLFTTLYQFESLCGTKPLYFKNDQKYSDLPQHFSAYAVPLNNTMFTAGSPEVGYVYAKELLKQGLPVLFERINGDYEPSEVAFSTAAQVKAYLEKDKASVQKKEAIDDFLYVDKESSSAQVPTWNGELNTNSSGAVDDWTIESNNKYYQYPAADNGEILAGADLFSGISLFDNNTKITVSKINLSDQAITTLTGNDPFSGPWTSTPVTFADFVTINSKIKVTNPTDGVVNLSNDNIKLKFGENMSVKYLVNKEIPAFSSVILTLSAFAGTENPEKDKLLNINTAYDIQLSLGKEASPLELNLEDVRFVNLTQAPANWTKNNFPNGTYYVHSESYSSLSPAEIKGFEDGTITEIPAKTYYSASPKAANISDIYNSLSVIYGASQEGEGLLDKGAYSIKYLTSGGYPVFEYDNGSLADKMVALANLRGDCVAIIDHTDNMERDTNPNHSSSVYRAAVNSFKDGSGNEFATMFTPWATYSRTTVDLENNQLVEGKSNQIRMPASFAYLNSMAVSIRTNANWLAVAGVARGLVNNLSDDGMTTKLSNAVADQMQPRQGVAVNTITDINPYGYTIWGNRTLKNNPVNLTATSFLNIRNLISDVKKVAYSAAKSLTYEQNNDVLWVNFQSKIQPLLNRMVSGYGISGYKIVRDTEHERYSEKATLTCKIILYPVYPVEDFYITVQLDDEEVTVE